MIVLFLKIDFSHEEDKWNLQKKFKYFKQVQEETNKKIGCFKAHIRGDLLAQPYLTTWNLLVPNIIAHTPSNWGSWTHEPFINQESQTIQFNIMLLEREKKDGLINVEFILISQKFVNFFLQKNSFDNILKKKHFEVQIKRHLPPKWFATKRNLRSIY